MLQPVSARNEIITAEPGRLDQNPAAVYLAGKATGWFELANSPEAQIYPLFENHYRRLCQRVLAGEELVIEVPEALPEQASKKLSQKDNKARMAALRKQLKAK